jgi:hypothetical protein
VSPTGRVVVAWSPFDGAEFSMIPKESDAPASPEPVPFAFAEHPVPREGVRRVGRVRVPITLHHAPWATLYRLPDGRLLWVVRLWTVDRPVRRAVSTSVLLRYCRVHRLPSVRAAIAALVQRALEADDPV